MRIFILEKMVCEIHIYLIIDDEDNEDNEEIKSQGKRIKSMEILKEVFSAPNEPPESRMIQINIE